MRADSYRFGSVVCSTRLANDIRLLRIKFTETVLRITRSRDMFACVLLRLSIRLSKAR